MTSVEEETAAKVADEIKVQIALGIISEETVFVDASANYHISYLYEMGLGWVHHNNRLISMRRCELDKLFLDGSVTKRKEE